MLFSPHRWIACYDSHRHLPHLAAAVDLDKMRIACVVLCSVSVFNRRHNKKIYCGYVARNKVCTFFLSERNATAGQVISDLYFLFVTYKLVEMCAALYFILDAVCFVLVTISVGMVSAVSIMFFRNFEKIRKLVEKFEEVHAAITSFQKGGIAGMLLGSNTRDSSLADGKSRIPNSAENAIINEDDTEMVGDPETIISDNTLNADADELLLDILTQ